MEIGRPTVFTEQTLEKLEKAFKAGANDTEACIEAEISPASLYNYQKANEDFLEKKKLWKDDLKYRAKINIGEAIRKGDIENSKWWLERKGRDEFSTKQETEHSGNLQINVVQYSDNNSLQIQSETISASLPEGDGQRNEASDTSVASEKREG